MLAAASAGLRGIQLFSYTSIQQGWNVAGTDSALVLLTALKWHSCGHIPYLYVRSKLRGILCSTLLQQGGTCVLVGDDRKKMAEAEELAKHNIGCQVYRSSIYYRRDGHLQVESEHSHVKQNEGLPA